jgi:phosphatidylglycerophosphate synthase
MDRDVRVVVLGLGELAHAIHESESLPEPSERERALERALDLAPAIRNGHIRSIYDRTRTMTTSTETVPSRLRERSGKDRPARELVVQVFFGPLANLVVRALLPLRVPPPAVVLANAAAGLLAAFALARGELALAALLLQLKTLLDNADGQLARATGRVGLVGRYLDTEADLVVNAALFAALGATTGMPWLALAAFCALTLLLSASFNVVELHREVHEVPTERLRSSGGRVERALELVYRIVFAPQDRLLRSFSSRRLERLLAREPDLERVRVVGTLAYYDRFTVKALANFGLSTQLAVLGVCLALNEPAAYLWLALACGLMLPVLQLRRERVARSAVLEPPVRQRRAA